ncbi:MAG: hypothetical protein IPH54_15445 [Rhodoferax sp.]|nr:hypothetical protein [Rhodoferax sp.]
MEPPGRAAPFVCATMTHTMPRNILLCTLGASWAVVAEVFGWLTPATLDLYAHHPQRAALDALRQQHGLLAPRRIVDLRPRGCPNPASLAALRTGGDAPGAPPAPAGVDGGRHRPAGQPRPSATTFANSPARVTLLAGEHCHGGRWSCLLRGGLDP